MNIRSFDGGLGQGVGVVVGELWVGHVLQQTDVPDFDQLEPLHQLMPLLVRIMAEVDHGNVHGTLWGHEQLVSYVILQLPSEIPNCEVVISDLHISNHNTR